MPGTEQADLEALLGALAGAGVEFIVVGGTAAVLHGAPTTTLDLDIVPRLDAENLDRLERLLADLGATARDPAGRRLSPTRQQIGGGGQLQLSTRLGPLDLIGRLHDGRGYEELAAHVETVREGDLAVDVVDLDTLIAIKSAAGRVRDRLVLPLLLALREEREGRGS